MIRTFRMLLRLLRIAHILARHDALAPLEEAAVAPGIVWLARLVSRREAGGRAGQKRTSVSSSTACWRFTTTCRVF